MLFICRMDAGLDSEPPDISQWEIGTGQSVELSIEDSRLQTHTKSAASESLANPNPSNEHVGVDDECLYIDIGQSSIPTSQSAPDTLDDELEEDEVEEDELEEDEVEDELEEDEIEEDDIVTDSCI